MSHSDHIANTLNTHLAPSPAPLSPLSTSSTDLALTPSTTSQQRTSFESSRTVSSGISYESEPYSATSPSIPAAANLRITTSPPAPAAAANAEEALPTYGEVEENEPGNPRFGRWRGWIEKRARERLEERNWERANGIAPRRGWNLEDDGPVDERERVEDDNEQGRKRDKVAENRMSKQQYRVANADATTSSNSIYATHHSRERSSSSLTTKDLVHLTSNINMYSIGSRFAKHIPERPNGAISIKDGGGVDRWVLIGTSDGLYVTDLLPVLSQSSFATSPTSPTSPTHPSEQLPATHQLFHGLAINQLDVFVEDQKKNRGVVFGLMGRSNEIWMWSLVNIINLIKWRLFTENSEPLDLTPPPNQSSAPQSHEAKRSSRAFIKSLFTPSAAPSKGKGKSSSPTSSPRSSCESNRTVLREQQEYVLVEGHQSGFVEHLEEGTKSSHLRDGSLSSINSGTTHPLSSTADSNANLLRPSSSSISIPSSIESPHSLPLSWARSSVALPLPKNHTSGSILFFTLSRVPPDPSTLHSGEDEYDEDNLPESTRRIREQEKGWLFLAVATAKTVYVFESRPSEKRIWAISNELYAPATPRFITLVRASPSSETRSPTARRASTSSSHSQLNSTLQSLGLVLGNRHKTVLVHLSDTSVEELTFHSTSSTKSPSVTPQVKATASVRAAVTAFVESKISTPPAGIRGDELSRLAVGRKVGENGESLDGDGGENEEWIGCEEVQVGKNIYYFMTKGRSTYVVASPLAELAKPASPSVPTPLPITLKPIHTFHWPQKVSKLAVISPRPPTPASHPIALVGFTKTGIAVQEGSIDLAGIGGKFFTPSKLDQVSELGDKASFDYGKPTGLLCTSGEWMKSGVGQNGEKRGAFCWTHGHSEFSLKWIG